MGNKIKKYAMLTGSMAMVILYPSLFMYFQNMSEGHFYEIFPSIGKNAVLAAGLLVVFGITIRNAEKAFFVSEISLLLLMNFNTLLAPVKKIIPGMRKAYFLVLVAAVTVFAAVLVKKKLKETGNFCKIIGLVFACLIVFNFVTAVPEMIQNKNKTEVSDGDGSDIINKTFGENKPDVYFFVFDEYAGFENIKRYYNYDNQEFADFLEEKGFNVSYGTRNTESIWTSTIVPNFLNLSYVASDDIYSIDNMARTENAYLYQLFANNGYQINMVNHLNTFKDTDCNVLNYKKAEGDNLSTFVLRNGIWDEIDAFVAWCSEKIGRQPWDYYTNLKEVLDIMEHVSDYTSRTKPTFTFAYAECPHDYFVFDADGNRIPEEDCNNWQNKDVYLKQYQYITKRIETIVTNIMEKDPDAVIILMSDHGARYPHMLVEKYGAEPYDASVETPYMQNALNCVYYKGEKMDIEGMTGINTLRTVLNTVFGTDYEMLEAPTGFKASTGY